MDCTSAFAFDTTGIHLTILTNKNFKTLVEVFQQDYNHSRIRPCDGGGRLTKKLVANLGSIAELVTTKEGTTTTPREILMDKKVSIEGITKPMFSYIGTIPTRGNTTNILTGMITYRSGNAERIQEIADTAKTWVDTQLAQEIWDLLGFDEASTILAPLKCSVYLTPC